MAEAVTHEAFGQADASGSLTEAFGGAAAVVLSILGLVHVAPLWLASIATIAVGVAFLVAGSAVAARFSRLLSGKEPRVTREAIGEEVAMESLCGAAGVVLGILSLLGAGATTLLPVAAIVFGGGLLLESGTASRLHGAGPWEHAAAGGIAGPEILIALSGIVLGILGLASFHPLVLSLVAMLSYGFAMLLSGTSLAARMLTLFAA
jgi:hypothetical protein